MRKETITCDKCGVEDATGRMLKVRFGGLILDSRTDLCETCQAEHEVLTEAWLESIAEFHPKPLKWRRPHHYDDT